MSDEKSQKEIKDELGKMRNDLIKLGEQLGGLDWVPTMNLVQTYVLVQMNNRVVEITKRIDQAQGQISLLMKELKAALRQLKRSNP